MGSAMRKMHMQFVFWNTNFFRQLSLPLYIKVTADSVRTVHQRSPRRTAHCRLQSEIFFSGDFLACNFVFLVMGPFEGWSKDSVIGLFLGLLALLAFIAFLFNKLCRFLQFYFDEKCLRPSCKCHECLTSRDT